MAFRRPLFPKKQGLALILAAALSYFLLTQTVALAESGPHFKMVELPSSSLVIPSQTPERDPFNWPASHRLRLRQVTAAEQEQDIFIDFTLQAIIWSPSRSQAVINGQLVAVDDMVEGALITHISQTKVSLSKNSRTHTLQFDTLDIDFGQQPDAKGIPDDT
ncbi:MAG: hypothetical protein RI601_09850 [Desulfurivibrionaceae bacterium]|nr:hypothetical protein [Desulfurivibrionaceae bacterium]